MYDINLPLFYYSEEVSNYTGCPINGRSRPALGLSKRSSFWEKFTCAKKKIRFLIIFI